MNLVNILKSSIAMGMTCILCSCSTGPHVALDQPNEQPFAMADRVMESLGGQAAWDNTRFLSWNFFGFRRHYWDRYTGDVRIELTDAKHETTVWLMNIHTMEGQMQAPDGRVFETPDMMEGGHQAWVNDSYWLLMPFKLRDEGVSLRYIGDDETASGATAKLIEVSFDDHVGLTPQNIYHIWVGRESGLVEQWAFFMDMDAETPWLVNPWSGWAQYGDIMLSGERGERDITDIAVFEHLPDTIFRSFDPVDFQKLPAAQ